MNITFYKLYLYIEYIYPTTFEPHIVYDVISSSELDGVLVVNIYEEFPELENLIHIVDTLILPPSPAIYIDGEWLGSLTELEGGNQYQIRFSQETTTNLFQLDD